VRWRLPGQAIGRSRNSNQIDYHGKIVHGGIDMDQNFTAVVKQDGPWWIGWIEEVPGVNCQERTRDELLKTLRVTLMEALEMNRTDARDAAGKGYEELRIAV
jgi:predicted RNase H-like HicB family nuclease